jgi:hypothetical protein
MRREILHWVHLILDREQRPAVVNKVKKKKLVASQ